jgi:hypothetical protein
MLKKLFFGILCIAALVAAMSFIAPASQKLTIHFENYVGNTLLKLDSAVYKNELGQEFTVSKFKYYISDIAFTRGYTSAKKPYEFNNYYLINEEDNASKNIEVDDLPEGEYLDISFTIGVDSLHNCSGAQSGALDPVNAMFWAWNTGYIFLKMEGKSKASHSPGNLLEFHIGGYKEPGNCIKRVMLAFDKPLWSVKGKHNYITIKADLSELFKTPTAIDFSKISSVTDFHNATTIADNYADMFSLKQ